jgi:RloB-like protein
MSKKPFSKPTKTLPSATICFIVEGFTEKHYIEVLSEFFGKKYEIHNCKGGGANGVLKEAQGYIKKNKEDFDEFIIVYDSDTRHDALKEVKQRENDLAQLENVRLNALDVCFERCLLSHFESPQGSGERCNGIIRKLKNHIPNYDKNDFDQLKKHLDKEKIELMAEKYNCQTVKTYFLKDVLEK